jgi:hypothetical protein
MRFAEESENYSKSITKTRKENQGKIIAANIVAIVSLVTLPWFMWVAYQLNIEERVLITQRHEEISKKVISLHGEVRKNQDCLKNLHEEGRKIQDSMKSIHEDVKKIAQGREKRK